MIDNSKVSNIPCRLHNVGEGGVAGADEVIDDNKGKSQQQINAEVDQILGAGGSVDERIVAAVNVEKTRAEEAESNLDGRVDTLEEAVGTGGSVDSRIASAVAPKANSADVYAKTETYTKEEVHNLITTPSQKYVPVTATDQTTSVTDVLPATGATDTTYRVGNWDGTQYNDSVFSEYAWNGSAYIKLSTKSQIGEVYDISANHADTKYADLAAALGTNGANIPQSLRKGGMSVKFVQSSDNKYVQYRLMSDTFNTTVANWQGVDDEPTLGSDNLVKSDGVKKMNALNEEVSSIILTGEVAFISGYYLKKESGVITPFRDDTTAVSNYLRLDNYFIDQLVYGYDLAPIGFFDENKEFISVYSPVSGGITKLTNVVLSSIAPSNAKYVVFSCYTAIAGEYNRVTIDNYKNTISKLDDKAFSSINFIRRNITPVNVEIATTLDINVEETKKVINSYTGTLVTVASDTDGNFKVSNFIDISCFHAVSITASSMGGFAYYAFYDKYYNFISSLPSPGEYILNHITNYLTAIPQNAVYVRLACCIVGSRYEPQPMYDLKVVDCNIDTSNKWNTKKWGLIGDSLTERNFRTTINYADYISQYTGIQLINKAVSGSGYKRGTNFVTQINNMDLDVDVITIFGSVNDSAAGIPIGNATDTGIETLCSYMNLAITTLRNRFPITPFGIISPTPCQGMTPLDSNTWMAEYSEKLKEVCALNSVPFLDLYHCSNLYPNSETFRALAYSKDDGNGTHPDETGHKIIAPRFKEFLETLLL